MHDSIFDELGYKKIQSTIVKMSNNCSLKPKSTPHTRCQIQFPVGEKRLLFTSMLSML